MSQKHIGAARGAARAGASGDPKATLQLLKIRSFSDGSAFAPTGVAQVTARSVYQNYFTAP